MLDVEELAQDFPTTEEGYTEVGADNVQRFLRANSQRLAVVDGGRLFATRSNGMWVDATASSPRATAAIQHMAISTGLEGQWGQRRTDELRTSLFHVLEAPSHYGVAVARSDDFDRQPLFPLAGGKAVDARTLAVLDPQEIAGYWMLDAITPGLDYRPELLDAPSDHPGRLLAAHYEPDPVRPRFQILRRLAYLLLGPHKTVDAIVMPESNAGKSTLCLWVSLALPGYVTIGSAVSLMSSQGQKFTAIQHRLANKRLVFLDEADKVDKPLPPGVFNNLADDHVTVEPKGKDSYDLLRRGNAVLVGASMPAIQLGQGTPERLGWAFDGEAIGRMPSGIRELVSDPEAQAWLCTYLLTAAADLWSQGYDASDGDSREMAARIHHENADPLQAALLEILVQDPDGAVCANEIKAKLAEYQEVPQERVNHSKAFSSALQAVFRSVRTSKPFENGKRNTRYTGISFREIVE